jgi:multicomponent Na+:H+ antiporter subunit D
MPDAIPPFLFYLVGALIVPFLRGRGRQIFALLIPVVAFINYFSITKGVHWTFTLLDFELILGRADAWSMLFLNIFTVVSFVGILYIIKENKALDLSAGLLYAGSAIGVVMAGDLLSLFFFWEMLTMGAVLCLLARKTTASGKAAYRYLLVHVCGGVVLLAGLMLHLAGGGSVAFQKIELEGLGAWLMFLGFGINCAWPLVGAWLTDTYPEASIGGVIFMATFTTKTAVYVLARTFPGEPSLLWIGVAMAIIPLFYALVETDLRKVLAYCLINQVGFMVIGIGLGSPLSLNGTAAHAYCHILYKALLFMAIGSVLYRTGKSKATELGGLYRSMPLTCLFCCIGALSTSFPLFCGFVSKSMIISDAAASGHPAIWLVLLVGSVGVFLVAGLKVPFFAFFSHDSGIRCEEAPRNQLLAMGIVAFLCVFVGTFPKVFLYPMLPYAGEASYEPYTVAHVTDQLALLFFSALAFTLLMRAGLYPAEIRSTNLDADWFYRRGGSLFYRMMDRGLNAANRFAGRLVLGKIVGGVSHFCEAGGARLAALALTPLWMAQGQKGEALEDSRQSLYRRARRGAFPVGLTACLAVLLLGLLSVIFLSK